MQHFQCECLYTPKLPIFPHLQLLKRSLPVSRCTIPWNPPWQENRCGSNTFQTLILPHHLTLSVLQQNYLTIIISSQASLRDFGYSYPHQSAINDPITVSQLILKEVTKGYIIGPFKFSPFPIFCTSPIGVAARKYSGKIFSIGTLLFPAPS